MTHTEKKFSLNGLTPQEIAYVARARTWVDYHQPLSPKAYSPSGIYSPGDAIFHPSHCYGIVISVNCTQMNVYFPALHTKAVEFCEKLPCNQKQLEASKIENSKPKLLEERLETSNSS
jgi:hypothetical protein